MKPAIDNRAQSQLLPSLEEQLNRKHRLPIGGGDSLGAILCGIFTFDSERTCRPRKPIRRMVGLLILKHLRNLSDERVVEEWEENMYFQYLCGERLVAQGAPCEASELVYFRQRIG